MNNSLFIEQAYSNGKFISGKNTFEVINPATQEVLGKVPNLTVEDCRKTITAAEKAGMNWRNADLQTRITAVKKMFDLVNSNKNELAELISLECGKPFEEALKEVTYGNSFLEWFAEEGKRSYGKTIPSATGGLTLQTIKQPVGVVAAITPWNFPLAMVTRKVAPALIAGCTVVLKPASQTPFTALALAKIAEDAGIPKGVFNVITSKDSKGIGKELATNSSIRKITFTGSTAVGSTLMQQAAGSIKRVSMELGGNAPFLVFDDADLEKAIQGAIASKFRNSGQTCVAVNRFYIHEKIYDQFAKRLAEEVERLKVGNGMKKGVQIGPLINQSGLEKVIEHVEDAVKKGAKVLTGGKPLTGFFYAPTVLVDVPNTALIAEEETFGPVCALFKFSSEEEGIQLANQTPFGLAAYFYSDNIHRCRRVSQQVESGMIGINTGMISNAAAPFGGVKQSGIGREGSKYGLDEYMEIKYLCFGS